MALNNVVLCVFARRQGIESYILL